MTFKKYLRESFGENEELEIIEKAESILKRYKDSPLWRDVITLLNNDDIDYEHFNDLQVLKYYLMNKDREEV